MADQVLVFRITARDDASKVFREVKAGVQAVDQTVIAGNKAVATSAATTEKAVAKVGAAATKAVPGIGTMRGALGSLAFVTAGLPGQLGSVASLLAAFSFGTLTSLGIFAGLYGIATAYKMIGEGAREAKERLEELLKADPLGRLAAIRTAMDQGERRALRERFRAELAGAPGMVTLSAGTEGEEARFKINPRIAELERNIIALDQVIGDVAKDLENDAGAAIKKTAEELARAAKAAREAREDAQEEQRAALVAGRAYFEEMEKLRLAELSAYQDAIRKLGLSRLLFGDSLSMALTGQGGVASARAATSLFGGGPELTLGMGRPGGPGALAGARKTLTGELGRIQNEMFDAIAESVRGVTEKMESAFEDAAAAVEKGGVNMVSAMALAANALAGLITGNQSALGSLGGITSGLSGLFSGAAAGGLAASLATPLGIAGIGLGFLDAITSSRSKDAMKEAHLAALRENDAQKPPATIYLNIDPFDPMNRDHQRAMDEARREAQAAGYRVDVRRGG